MDTLMNKLKENKKSFVIILIISLIAIILGSYAIYKNSNKDETANKIEKSEKLEKKAEKKLKEAKKSGNKEEIAKAEKELKEAEAKTEEVKNKKSDSSSSASSSSTNTSKSSPTASKPSTSSSSGATSTSKPAPKPKEKTKVWIVDKPAWTETVQEPIYSTRTRFLLKDDNNNQIGVFYSTSEVQAKQKELSRQNILTSYSMYDEEYINGYNTKTINHPEEGHWEYR